ncbi:MAG: hypothetical protein PUC29_08855, partial [Clostridia bacterium]|nr:hypothetical protein [Clostridia bacterium]
WFEPSRGSQKESTAIAVLSFWLPPLGFGKEDTSANERSEFAEFANIVGERLLSLVRYPFCYAWQRRDLDK